jgi:hypothetical protein
MPRAQGCAGAASPRLARHTKMCGASGKRSHCIIVVLCETETLRTAHPCAPLRSTVHPEHAFHPEHNWQLVCR